VLSRQVRRSTVYAREAWEKRESGQYLCVCDVEVVEEAVEIF
jgi:hypothetical protein